MARLDVAQQDGEDNRLHEIDEDDELEADQLETRLVNRKLWFLLESGVELDDGVDCPSQEETADDLDPDVCVFGVPRALAVPTRGFCGEFQGRQQDVDDAVDEDADVADVEPFQAASGDYCVGACGLPLVLRLAVLECREVGGAGVFVWGHVLDVQHEEGREGEGLVEID